jgi:hypothetical protein
LRVRRCRIDHHGQHRQRGAQPSRSLQTSTHFTVPIASCGTSNKRHQRDESAREIQQRINRRFRISIAPPARRDRRDRAQRVLSRERKMPLRFSPLAVPAPPPALAGFPPKMQIWASLPAQTS